VHTDARHELALAEWLDEIIVRADLEPDDAVGLVPEDLLFAADGRLKVIDFGVAKSQDVRTIAADRKVTGTLRYMAPEFSRRYSLTIRGRDVFAVGVVLEDMGAVCTIDFFTIASSSTARRVSGTRYDGPS